MPEQARAGTCSVEGCQKPARGPMCVMHYTRVRRGGTTERRRPIETVDQRYARLVIRTETGCWGWSGSTNPQGYGRIGKRYAHRVSYERHHGPIPPGMYVMHSCDNPPCTNPAHLSLGTHADNMADAARKGRKYVKTRRAVA